jgi:peptidoglycan/xylan/chitin deacetylase (PgdA/CDA1 family)
MNPFLVKTPRLLHRMFPKRIWALPNETNTVYLTFDDGPIPEVTPWVLNLLKEYSAKATFFLIGENIRKNPGLFNRIISEGHSVGNHTFHHLNGWKTKTPSYLEDVTMAETEMLKLLEGYKSISGKRLLTTQKLFRPPYGKLSGDQARHLINKGYSVIMWNVLSGDYDAALSEEKCLQNVVKNIRPGSIVVFHDSLKAEKNLRFVLPKVLDFLSENCLVAKSLDSQFDS